MAERRGVSMSPNGLEVLLPLERVDPEGASRLTEAILSQYSTYRELTRERVAAYVTDVTALNELLRCLSEHRQRETVVRRFGLLGSVDTYRAIGLDYGVDKVSIQSSYLRALATLREEIDRKEAERLWSEATTEVERLAVPLEILRLSIRERNCIKRVWCAPTEFKTLGALVQLTEQDLYDVRGIGRLTVERTKAGLKKLGLSLKTM
jgi:hypothetical protein